MIKPHDIFSDLTYPLKEGGFDVLEQSEVLMAFAGLAISLIGFTGIVVVFGARSKAGWSKEDYQKLVLLITPSLTVFFGAVLPIILAAGNVPESLNWRISNGIFAALHLGSIGWFVINPVQARISRGQLWNLPHGVAAIIANILAAAGYMPWPAMIYLIGLTQQLWIGIYNFLLMLAPRIRPRDEKPNINVSDN